MKAKEYANKFMTSLGEALENENGGGGLEVQKSVSVLADHMFLEIGVIAKQRRAEGNSAMMAIIKEQIQKWKAVCRIVNAPMEILNPEGFQLFVEKQMSIKIEY